MKKGIFLLLITLLLCGCNTSNPTDSTIADDCNDTVVSAEKPVIYLYNYGGQEVTVKLEVDGKLTCTYPKYNESTGWVVKAETNGTLKDTGGGEYNYLYWEGNLITEYDFSKGFCVKGSDTESFLESELIKLGLNKREANEFIIYWLPRMQDNPYNVISFQTSAYTSKAKLTVTPAPDKQFRVFMAWYSSETPVELEKQEFKIPQRSGKVLVEWGGTEVEPNTHAPVLGISGLSDQHLVAALAKKTPADIQTILGQVATTWQQQNTPLQTIPAPQIPSMGHSFTDKNGATTTFTDAEWEKLVNTWIYVGSRSAAEELISHHTVAELRKVLGQ